MLKSVLAALVLTTAHGTSRAQDCVWGSFDASRINYAEGELAGNEHDTLRGIIAATGGTLAPATPVLDAAYLDGVDVFYTSLLKKVTGALSDAEQTALQNWIAGGGTLIVTGDVFPLPAYESFTAFYGVTGWAAITVSATSAPIASHSITAGVRTYQWETNATFRYGSDALLLGNDDTGNPFCVVLEPATGFTAGGRILVFGDHNMFTDGFIGTSDNRRLAENFAAWACDECNADAGWNNYGTGWPGTLGVPSFAVSSGDPLLGTTMTLDVGNSLGQDTLGLLLYGVSEASIATSSGGTLLLVPYGIFAVPVPASGVRLNVQIRDNPALCGLDVYMQILEVDIGASHGISFTEGLKLLLGTY